MSPKAAKTRSLLRLMDDGLHMTKQLSQLLNVTIKARLFTDSYPLLESIESSGQNEEKSLKQSVAYFKQSLEDEVMMAYSGIPGEEIVADFLTKQGSRHDILEEILVRNLLRHVQPEENLVIY